MNSKLNLKWNWYYNECVWWYLIWYKQTIAWLVFHPNIRPRLFPRATKKAAITAKIMRSRARLWLSTALSFNRLPLKSWHWAVFIDSSKDLLSYSLTMRLSTVFIFSLPKFDALFCIALWFILDSPYCNGNRLPPGGLNLNWLTTDISGSIILSYGFKKLSLTYPRFELIYKFSKEASSMKLLSFCLMAEMLRLSLPNVLVNTISSLIQFYISYRSPPIRISTCLEYV